MKVISRGRDYGYEMVGVTMLFFRGEKVSLYTGGELPREDYVLTEAEVRSGRVSLSVTVERDGRRYEASEIIPVEEMASLSVGGVEFSLEA